MDGTILGQGTFTVGATVTAQTVQIPSNADFMWVRNATRQGTVGGAAAYGFRYYWQRGMAAGEALVEYYANGGAVVTGDRILTGGFTLFDPSGSPLGTSGAIVTSVSNATRPVVTTNNATSVAVGDIVRLSGTAQTDVNGVDFVVGAINAGVSFTLLAASNALATAPGAGSGAVGTWQKINFDPLYYPRRRFVTNITQAANAQVSTSVPHQYVPGQAVRFSIPAVSGMTQLNPSASNNYMYATVVSVVDVYNFTINIDTTAYTAFTWPTIAQQPSGFPQVEPIGENTALALSSTAAQTPTDANGNVIYSTNNGILSDSTVNTGFLGMILGTGANGAISGAAITGPAGSVTGDVVYWAAGKSTYGGL